MIDVDAVYRTHSRRVLATLIRLLGDFDLAEEALQDAFVAAVEQWPREGAPANPYTWLVSAGRFKAIDRLRRRARFDKLLFELATRLEEAPDEEHTDLPDDRLRLIFTCCHPALPPDAQVAMTLREVCGLTTEEIARAFLTGPPTVAQRIVRAKNKIKINKIGYAVPVPAELPGRLDPVLSTVYLIFTEAYAPSAGPVAVRTELADEAIRLGWLLAELLPDPEVLGLLALMLLQDSRRDARTAPDGEIVLLPDQDRSLWRRDQIDAAAGLLRRARSAGEVGTYTLQAEIALVHAEAPAAQDTDWRRVVDLYDLLVRADPSPVAHLNRAVALAMRDGPAAGLAALDAVLADGRLDDYHLAHSARADLLRRLGRTGEARAAYERALELARQEPQRRFLARRLAELPTGA
ncbi:RNA polymerase sigma factor [Phytohabitans houttuyneae]|uniref:DNA-directed RNA polymerase sigma-70 factor n=1 Tax=Phytohabitans houttuyneae TaxID=1076126 RepID=A0A6V8KBC8_9ACTN|nr:RNA polymerase sigma factor [Phytohabitans houttuyneae]GFJ79698.1 DNA-directed RNA polymerase sigma-70 factor [Phytohabitans houttuyneae]